MLIPAPKFDSNRFPMREQQPQAGQHRRVQDMVPRLFLIESEYLSAMVQAEIAWVRRLVEDLRAGALTWTEQWIRAVAERFRHDPEA
jgi:hypothetical protein